MHTIQKRSHIRPILLGLTAVIVIIAVWTLFMPHRLSDTDQFGYSASASDVHSMLGTIDHALFGAFAIPDSNDQTDTWQTYQDGPITVRYQSTGNGFNTVLTNNNTNPMMYGYGYGYPDMMGGMFITLVFWALIIAGAVLVVRYFMRSATCGVCGHDPRQHHAHGGHHALDILAERYARGEIDKNEYESKKKDIAG